MKKKLRYGSMAIAVAIGVGAFLLAQRLDLIPGPWSKNRPSWITQAQMDALHEAQEDPQDYMSYYRRGLTSAKQRQLERALMDLNTAVRLRPTPLSLEVLGARAASTLEQETRTLNRVVLVYVARADVLQQMNRPEEALADLDQALAFDSRKMDIFYQRGMLRMVTGRHGDAVADFNVVLETRKDADWYFGRGIAKYLQGNWTGAIEDFRNAARMAPSNTTFAIWLAKSYLRAGVPIPPEDAANIGDARYVIEAFMSDYKPAEFMSSMRAGAAYVGRRRGVQCDTALFMGEWLVMRKRGAGAREMFTEAQTSCGPLSIERAVATAELGRLQP
jgi:tetratricopeptide (TPR) repeat protein